MTELWERVHAARLQYTGYDALERIRELFTPEHVQLIRSGQIKRVRMGDGVRVPTIITDDYERTEQLHQVADIIQAILAPSPDAPSEP